MKSSLSNHSYNLANQLSKKLEAVKHYEQIQKDDAKHAKMLQEHINELGKKNKFK